MLIISVRSRTLLPGCMRPEAIIDLWHRDGILTPCVHAPLLKGSLACLRASGLLLLQLTLERIREVYGNITH